MSLWVGVLGVLATTVFAHEGGPFDGDHPPPPFGGHGPMKNFFHFEVGDVFYIRQFELTTAPIILGACAVVFVFAVLERAVSAGRAVMERKFLSKFSRQRIALESDPKGGSLSVIHLNGYVPPFMFRRELARGGMFAVQASLTYLIMLAIMTFHVSIILAVIVGSATGEFLFGRYTAATVH